ncbi:MAG: head-tail connector protein [Pseudomonadota bacterium]
MYTLITPPVAEPLSLSEVKQALRIDHDSDDSILEGMISTARTFIERRLDRALLTQAWSARVEGVPQGPVPLRPGPVSSVLSVTVMDDDSNSTLLLSEDWTLCGDDPQSLLISAALMSNIKSVEVVFEAGAATPNDIPADILRAVYLLAAHYYEERELYRQQRYVSVPLGVEALIEAYREMRL